MILGIDPGLSGGLAVIDGTPPTILEVIDVPTTGEKAKRRVNVIAVMKFIRRHPGITAAFIERSQAMPGQGVSSGFIYGRAVGALETCVEGMLIPLTVIESTAWKKAHGLIKTGKEDSRQRAIRLFPTSAGRLELMKHHNRAESALIAWYGLMLERGNVRAA